MRKAPSRQRAKYGTAKSPEYRRAYFAWYQMVRRTTNPAHEMYHCYGGRGISVDPPWLEWPRFFADMGPMEKGLSLERKDVNSGYSKENCCYIPKALQAQNKRSSIRCELNGETLCASEAARRVGMPKGTLFARLRRGMTAEAALAMPFGKASRPVKVVDPDRVRRGGGCPRVYPADQWIADGEWHPVAAGMYSRRHARLDNLRAYLHVLAARFGAKAEIQTVNDESLLVRFYLPEAASPADLAKYEVAT